MSAGRESCTPIGSNLPGYDNYFCRDCRRIVHVRKGSAGFRACPTPGCTRPTGFGVYATMPRPAIAARMKGPAAARTTGSSRDL